MKKSKKEIGSIFKKYIDDIDDYYDAKDEFIKDVNIVLKKHYGDKDGVMCKKLFEDAYATFEDMVNNR